MFMAECYHLGGFAAVRRVVSRAGNKNKLNPAYRMIYFYPEGYTQNADNNGFYTQNADNILGNTGYNIRDNMGYNMPSNRQGSMGDIIINQNKGYTGTKRGFDEDDDDAAVIRAGEEPEDDPISDRTEREAAIRAAYLRSFGWMPNRSEVNALVLTSHIAGFSPVMVAKALEIAAGEGARKPVQYTREILADWKNAHVMQPHQIDEYRVREDILKNCIQLFPEKVRRNLHNTCHAGRILCSEGCHSTHCIDSIHGHRFDVCLDTGASAGIRSCDCQCFSHMNLLSEQHSLL